MKGRFLYKLSTVLGCILLCLTVSGCRASDISVTAGPENYFQTEIRKIHPDEKTAGCYIHQDGVKLSRYIGEITPNLYFLGTCSNYFYLYSYNTEKGKLEEFADLSIYTAFFSNVMNTINGRIYLSVAKEDGNVLLCINAEGEQTVIKEWPWGAWHGVQFGICGKYLTCTSDNESGRILELYDTEKNNFAKIVSVELGGSEEEKMAGEDLLAGFGLNGDGFYYQLLKLENNTISDLSEASVCYYDLKKKRTVSCIRTDHVNNYIGGDGKVLFASEYEYEYPINPGVLYLCSENEAIKIPIDTDYSDWSNIQKTGPAVYAAEAGKKLYIIDIENRAIKRYEAWIKEDQEAASYQIQLYDKENEKVLLLYQGDCYITSYDQENDTGEEDYSETESSGEENSRQIYIRGDEVEFETICLKVNTKFDGVSFWIVLPGGLFFDDDEPACIYSNIDGVNESLKNLKTGDRLKVRIKGKQRIRFDETHPCQVEITEARVTEPSETIEPDETIIHKIQSFYEFEVLR